MKNTLAKPSTTLVLFDLDHTLTPWDTDKAWGDYLYARGWLSPSDLARYEAFYVDYVDGKLQAVEYAEFSFVVLKKIPMKQRDALLEQYVLTEVMPAINVAARELVTKHQERGDQCVLTTATMSAVTAPIARELNLPLIAPEALLDVDGDLTGGLATPHNMGVNKVSNAKRWLKTQGLSWEDFSTIYVYSDSMNDVPLLSVATHPVATNPSPSLAHYAAERGWQQLWLYPAPTV